MLRKIGCLLTVLVLTGCGGGSSDSSSGTVPPAKTASGARSSAESAQALAAGKSQASGSATESASGAAARKATASEDSAELAKQLERLTERANAAQQVFEFSKAAAIWREALPIVQQLHGEKSWQAANARLAAETAEIETQFDRLRLTGLKELFEWQSRIADLLKEVRYLPALEQAERSMQRTQELFGAESYMMAKQWVQVARLRQLSGRTGDAVSAYREAIQSHEKLLGELHPDLEALHGYLGETFLAMNQIRPAIENLKKAAWMAQQLWGEKSLKYATRANDLGVAFQRAGDQDTALLVLRAAETIRRDQLGPEDPLVAHSLLNMGTVYLELRRSELAVQCFEQALPLLVQKMGISARFVVEGHLRYSAALVLSGKNVEAERVLQQLVDQLTHEPGAVAELATAKYRLGVLQAKQGRYETAEPHLKAALEAQIRIHGDEHESVLKSKLALARLYEQTGRKAEADVFHDQLKQVNFEQPETQFKK